MENYRHIKISKIIIWGGTLLVLPFILFAYDDKTTHPALTQEIVKFYNKNFPENQLNTNEAELVIKGSIDEDKDARWLYHFYDPVYNRGLVLENDAFPDDTSLALIASGAKSSYESSKEWGTRSELQNSFWNLTAGIFSDYFSGSKDYSWERAIYEYSWRDKNRGLETLGHILHLLEDSTVPDHTRNDPHPPILDFGSPYEFWTKKFDRNNFEFTTNEKPKFLSNIEAYFDDIARYSNNNFFSKDTVFYASYDGPVVKYYLNELGYNNLSYPLVRRVKKLGGGVEYTLTDEQNKILASYWNLLSKQAVLHGAGAIKLFFDEVEKEKQTRALYNKNRSWFGKLTTSWFGKIWDNFWGTNTNISTTNSNLALVVSSSNQTIIAPINSLPQSIEVALPTGSETSPTAAIGSVLGISTIATNIPSPISSSGGGGGDYSSPSTPTPTPQPTPTETPETATSSPETTPPGSDGSTTTPEVIPPPSINFSAKECESSFSNETCLIATTTINIEWSSDTTALGHFEIFCLLNSSPCAGFDFSNTTATSTIYNLPEDNSIYTFSAKAVDSLNQESSTTVKTVEFATRPVIINEIGWAGTSSANPQDEWIELYNPTASKINLSGIKIKSLTDGKPEIALEGTLGAEEYYLIERTDDTPISDVPANLAVPFGGGAGSGLSNSGEILILEFNGAMLDQTPDPEGCSGWCAGVASPYFYSMERYDPLADGSNKNNWNHWNGMFAAKHGANGSLINGTPGERNSVNYWIDNSGSYLTKNKTLKKSSSPYVIPSSFTIPEGLTLKIEPGVVIKFVGRGSMEISGKLEAAGNEENPVVFTSLKDDSYAGDTNQDTGTTEAGPGDWNSIKIIGAGSADISNTIIRFGGVYDPLGFSRAALKAEGGNLSVKNSVVENSGSLGVWLRNASSSFFQNEIRNNAAFNNSDSTGMVVEGGTVEITENAFKNNYFGLMLLPSPDNNPHDLKIKNNSFVQNQGYAIFTANTYPVFSGNSATENGINGIGIQMVLADNYSLLPDLPYVIENNSFYIPENKTLNILPGTVLKFYGTGTMQISGTLKAEGAAENKIIFTSLNDDEYGGDTNGTSTEANPGDWLSVDFLAGSKGSILNNTIIRYGGNKLLFLPSRGALRIFTASSTENALQIKNSIVEKNYAAGIRMENAGSAVIENSAIQDNLKPDGELTSGLSLINSSLSLSNTLFKNNKIGIWADADSSVENLGGIIFEDNITDTEPFDLLP